MFFLKMYMRRHMSDIVCAYGMTETSPCSLTTVVDDPLDIRCTTVGRVMPHLQVKVIDSATGRTLPLGEVGEICTSGYR